MLAASAYFVATCHHLVTDNEEYNVDDHEVVECWENEVPETLFDYDDNTSTDDDAPELPEDSEALSSNETFGLKLLNWLLIFIMRLQAKHYLCDTAIQSILKFICAVLSIIDKRNGCHFAEKIPSSKYSLLKHFSF